jgi:hypothetical protein
MALPISGTINDNQAGILRPRKTATPLIINEVQAQLVLQDLVFIQ